MTGLCFGGHGIEKFSLPAIDQDNASIMLIVIARSLLCSANGFNDFAGSCNRLRLVALVLGILSFEDYPFPCAQMDTR